MSRFERLAAFCAVEALHFDAEIFARFEDDLYACNAVMNLTRVSRQDCEIRHFIDSLLVASLIPSGACVLDLGAGPGFPAWPLACARPDLLVVALDSSGKMLGFLRRHPLPNLEVRQARAENEVVADEFDVVTGRAVAPLPIQLELSAPRTKVGGRVIPFRTPNDLSAIESFPARILGLELEEAQPKEIPGTDIFRLFPIFAKVAPTPKTYPRAWATMRAKPLGS